jgi:hypothetical protein
MPRLYATLRRIDLERAKTRGSRWYLHSILQSPWSDLAIQLAFAYPPISRKEVPRGPITCILPEITAGEEAFMVFACRGEP